MPNDAPKKVLEIDGRKLFYEDQGSGSPVLILHGATLDIPGSWDKPVAALLESGYRMIFPYRAGRGPSDPHPVFVSLARDSHDCWTLMDRLNIDRVALIGHSQGACVAADMVLKQPDRIAGIVSEDSSAFGKFGSQVGQLGIDRFDEEDRALYERYQATITFLGRPYEYPSEYNVWRLLMRRAAQSKPQWMSQQVPDPDDAPLPPGKWCKTPLLAFAAGRGRLRPEDPEARELADSLPAQDARLVVVTKSGHGIHEEQPDLFITETMRFLASLW